MKVVLISPGDDSREWETELRPLFPELDWRVGPETDPGGVQAALVWKPPHGSLARFPDLRLIQGLGMGVDYLFEDPTLPDVPIARLVDDNLISQMSEYVCLAVLRQHRRAGDYARLQVGERWEPLPAPDTREATVGILGLGTIGMDTAPKLQALGFPVIGWSRTPKTLPGVDCYTGDEGLRAFLGRSRFLVCLLPLTPATRDILDRETLGRLPRGAYLVNCARGQHLVEEDLLALLAEGHLAGATLDVFREEPLPAGHPFWQHPGIHITPHVAGLTNAWAAAPVVAENLRRLRDGAPLLYPVDRQRGY